MSKTTAAQPSVLPPNKVKTTTTIDAVNEDDDHSRLNMVSNENIFPDSPRSPGSKQDEPEIPADIWQGKPWNIVQLCMVCYKEGDHWSARCPRSDLVEEYLNPSGFCACCDYGHEEVFHQFTLRVTNLSKDVKDSDLAELFGHFGPFGHAAINNPRSRDSERFAFVDFKNRIDAERAIKSFNGKL